MHHWIGGLQLDRFANAIDGLLGAADSSERDAEQMSRGCIAWLAGESLAQDIRGLLQAPAGLQGMSLPELLADTSSDHRQV